MISSHVFLFRSNRYRRFARSFEYRWLAGATLEPINNDVAIGTVELPASEPTLAASATTLMASQQIAQVKMVLAELAIVVACRDSQNIGRSSGRV